MLRDQRRQNGNGRHPTGASLPISVSNDPSASLTETADRPGASTSRTRPAITERAMSSSRATSSGAASSSHRPPYSPTWMTSPSEKSAQTKARAFGLVGVMLTDIPPSMSSISTVATPCNSRAKRRANSRVGGCRSGPARALVCSSPTRRTCQSVTSGRNKFRNQKPAGGASTPARVAVSAAVRSCLSCWYALTCPARTATRAL